MESDLIRERTMAGQAIARANGVRFGRKGLSDETKAEIRRLHLEGLKPKEIAAQLKLGRATIYKHLEEAVGPEPTDEPMEESTI
jgi:DNA invertase Pin-like site-specific DNA recombinase